MLGSSMAFIDGTVVNVALPACRQNLRATAAGLQWVVERLRADCCGALILVGGALRRPLRAAAGLPGGRGALRAASLGAASPPDVGS